MITICVGERPSAFHTPYRHLHSSRGLNYATLQAPHCLRYTYICGVVRPPESTNHQLYVDRTAYVLRSVSFIYYTRTTSSSILHYHERTTIFIPNELHSTSPNSITSISNCNDDQRTPRLDQDRRTAVFYIINLSLTYILELLMVISAAVHKIGGRHEYRRLLNRILVW
ncbi:uncharacterized protein EDB91DRAFT_158916 [Suillus paluster]|uniref:uncharacterized protein n=1 Tax=Suillus paluster TaxID=48578 RepID=UPI001B86A561|nr:uncharacterized protein EDB91DRAFT_158916 [Suillus paluster]KAG1723768.1 hypothetical protein EDB91DRAFT_158916 [Suillus paluster]